MARWGAVAAERRRTGRSGARRRGGGASGGGHRRGRAAVAWPRPRCAEAGGAGRRRAALLQPMGGGGGRGAGAAAAGAVHDGASGPGVPRLLRSGSPRPRRARSPPPCALPSRAREVGARAGGRCLGTPAQNGGSRCPVTYGGMGAGSCCWVRPCGAPLTLSALRSPAAVTGARSALVFWVFCCCLFACSPLFPPLHAHTPCAVELVRTGVVFQQKRVR